MINSIIAYDINALEKRKVYLKIKTLYKNGFVKKEQFEQAKTFYATNIFSPSIFVKILLFIVTYIGLSTIALPISLFFEEFLQLNLKQNHYQVLSFIFGIVCFIFIEKVLIKNAHHYKSGITEAGIFSGLGFVAYGIFGFESSNMIIYPLVGLLLCSFASIRYLNITCLIGSVFFYIWLIYELLNQLGSIATSLFPFIIMIFFITAYFIVKKTEKKPSLIILDENFTVLKSACLLVFYIAGNYFVVRELSIELMNLKISANEDIPFAIFFYIFTAITPFCVLYFGIKSKSIFLIRNSIIMLIISIATFKYYFSLGHPLLSITIAGALLIIISLILLNYLKEIRFGFTREKIFQPHSFSDDLVAFIASQTLVESAIDTSKKDILNGGEFGGAGAGNKW